MPPLTHYTRSAAAVRNILNHGFMWYPSSRRLAELLLPGYAFGEREPQRFGMISFTESAPQYSAEHRQAFGDFGIVITENWARKHRAQRVFYVPKAGPLTDALRTLFLAGAADLTKKLPYPDDGAWLSSFENRSMAAMVAGAGVWRQLLTIWEYLEPEESAFQREWRVVNPDPDSTTIGAKPEAIAAVSPPQNWGKFTRVLPIAPDEVSALVCPSSMVETLRSSLPEQYHSHAIHAADA